MKNKSFLSQFVSLGIGSFLYLLVGLLGTPVITRLVDPVSYGDYSIFTVYSSIALAVCVLGLDQSFVRFFYSRESDFYRRRLLYACLTPSLALLIFAGVLLLVLSPFSAAGGMKTTACFILANTAVGLIHRYSTLGARLQYDTNLYSAINISQKVLFLLISIGAVLVFNEHFPVILMIATIVSTLLASLIGIVRERNLWFPKKTDSVCPDVSSLDLLKYGVPLLFSFSITLLFNALDKLALDRFCTRADVGVYTSALNLLAVFNVIRTSFNALWIPSAVAHYEQNPNDKTYFEKGNAFISILMLLFGAGMILCKDLFVLLLGEDYRDAASIFPFLIFEPIMYTISETTVTGLVVTRKSSSQVIVAAVACLTNFVGNWILTPILGPKGAAISTGVSYIVFFAMRTVLSNRVYYVNYHLPKFALMTTLLMLYAAYGSSHGFSVTMLLGFLLYCAVLILIYFKQFQEALSYGKTLLRKAAGRM